MKMLKDDLDRESLEIIKHELVTETDKMEAKLEELGSYLAVTADADLPKLKASAQICKGKIDFARHLLSFFDSNTLDRTITLIDKRIIAEREKQANDSQQ